MIQKISELTRREPAFVILFTFAIVVLVVMDLLLEGKFLSFNNVQSMAYQVPEFALIAMAMAITMMTGGIDLSVITNANLASILAGFVLTGKAFSTEGLSEPLVVIIAVIVGLAAATLGGLINGLLISKVSVPPILATLGTMVFFNGVAMAITGGKGVVGFPELFLRLGTDAPYGIPLVFILFVVVFIVVMFVLARTPFGKSVYLLGENRIASMFAGLDNEKLLLKVYTLSGFLVGIAAIIIASRVNSAKVGYGDTYLLQAILVAVLGGVNPEGGRGKILNVILGVLILQMLQSGFNLFAFSPYAKRLIFGLMLLLVMVVNFYFERIQHRSRWEAEKYLNQAEGGAK